MNNSLGSTGEFGPRTPALPDLIDLEIFARLIRKRPGGNAVREAIFAARDAALILEDIKRSLRLLMLLSDRATAMHAAPPGTHMEMVDEGLTGGALFAQAVIGYLRVVHGSGPLRKMPLAGLSPALLAIHRRMVTLRDEAFAHHVHKESQPQGPWRRQFILAAPDGEKLNYHYPTQGKNWTASDANDLAELLKALLDLARDHHSRCGEQMHLAINKFGEADPDVIKLLIGAKFEGGEGSQELVAITRFAGPEFDYNSYGIGLQTDPSPEFTPPPKTT